jgi:Flp pilus assembly protein TadG
MRLKNRRTLRTGAATVEFALVAPLYFLFVFALFEFGRMMMVQQSLTNAAREGCRKAVIATTLNSSDVDKAVRDCLQSVTSKATDPAIVRVKVPANLANCPNGTALTVAIEVDYRDVTWLPLGYSGLDATLRAAETARRE